jgi:hypothetical protein
MSTTTPKIHVVLKRPRPVSALISLAQAIESAMSSAKVTFPSPTPTLAQFTSDIGDLVTAENAAKMRTKGAVQTRDAKLAVVIADLKLLVAYVETVANADPSNAAAIAISAGMVIRKPPVTSKSDLNFRKTAASGSVVVMARVGSRQKEAHEWEYSVDGGKTWLTLPTTTQAKTTITGLTTGSSVQVRHRAVSTTGITAWSDAASSMVT